MFSPYAVANKFLELAHRDNEPITNLKMQKLVYFANGVFLGMTGIPLVNESFEAWTYGPVLRSLYRSLSVFGAESILAPSIEPCEDAIPNTSIAERIIESVWRRLGDWPASRLVDLSHVEGSPWKMAMQRGGKFTSLSNDEIREYFRPPSSEQ